MLDIPERSLRAEANVVEKLRPNGKKRKEKKKKGRGKGKQTHLVGLDVFLK